MQKNLSLRDQWPLIQKGIADLDFKFELNDESIADLIDLFNIKLQKCSSGFICFQGHKVGLARKATCSGMALCRFLHSQEFNSSVSIEEVIKHFEN